MLFTRLIIKTDDGHFLGILNENGFNLAEWLRYRYETISGRTVCEFLTMEFLRTNLIVWKLCAALMWIAIVYFIIKITGGFAKGRTYGFALSIPFLVFVACLNPAAFWFSGSLTYLFPFGCMVLTLAPIVYDLTDTQYKRVPSLIASFFAAFVACSQEQSAALTLGFYAVTLVFLIIKKKAKIYHFVSLLPCAFQTYMLFSSPGMQGRMETESGGFERFGSMGIFDKILCGITNYYSFGFMESVIVFGFFIVILVLKLKELYSSRALRCSVIAFASFSLVGGNVLSLAMNGAIPDKAFEKMFASGHFTVSGIIITAVCTVTLLLIVISLAMIARKDFKIGISALVCYAAGMCSAVILGFSSSIYASGQRVFFFSEILTLIACAIILSSMKNERHRKATENTAAIVALVMFFVNCMSWAFLEIPIMGQISTLKRQNFNILWSICIFIPLFE